MKDECFDAVIIGSGAGGGPLALSLSQAGFQVLVLEKGPRYSRDDYVHDEIKMSIQTGFFEPVLSEEPHILCTKGRSEPSLTGWVGRCVGGATTIMGAALYRFHELDFQMKSAFGDYDELEDWPYTYDSLERFYGKAEWTIGISGDSTQNCWRRSVPFPLPPLKAHSAATIFDQVCHRLGLHPLATPRAINSEPYDGRAACHYCSTCTGYGCPYGARGSTQETMLDRAEQTGNCKIFAEAMVREILVSPQGRAQGCVYIDSEGLEHKILGKIICICCSAVESARLLLLSQSGLFPDGLANGTGLVGRHLQFHAVSSAKGRFSRKEWRRAEQSEERYYVLGRSLMDYYFLPDAPSAIPKGGLLRFEIVRPRPITTAQILAWEDSGSPLWGQPLKRKLREYFQNTVEIECEVFHDFIPTAANYMDLDPAVRDKWGLPVARIHLEEPAHQKIAGAWLIHKGVEILNEMGAETVKILETGGSVPFLVHGTCRAGKDPAKSVLNEFCQSHEVRNLFVVDGSFMPTSGGAPPTLTILANSFRTASYIVSNSHTGQI